MELIKNFINDESGQGLVEYALIIGLIAIVVVVSVNALGTSIGNLWGRIAGDLDTVAP